MSLNGIPENFPQRSHDGVSMEIPINMAQHRQYSADMSRASRASNQLSPDDEVENEYKNEHSFVGSKKRYAHKVSLAPSEVMMVESARDDDEVLASDDEYDGNGGHYYKFKTPTGNSPIEDEYANRIANIEFDNTDDEHNDDEVELQQVDQPRKGQPAKSKLKMQKVQSEGGEQYHHHPDFADRPSYKEQNSGKRKKRVMVDIPQESEPIIPEDVETPIGEGGDDGVGFGVKEVMSITPNSPGDVVEEVMGDIITPMGDDDNAEDLALEYDKVNKMMKSGNKMVSIDDDEDVLMGIEEMKTTPQMVGSDGGLDDGDKIDLDGAYKGRSHKESEILNEIINDDEEIVGDDELLERQQTPQYKHDDMIKMQFPVDAENDDQNEGGEEYDSDDDVLEEINNLHERKETPNGALISNISNILDVENANIEVIKDEDD